jgi:hypothetical protein
MSVKRYKHGIMWQGEWLGLDKASVMAEGDDGDYVLASDYDALIARVEQIERERAALIAAWPTNQWLEEGICPAGTASLACDGRWSIEKRSPQTYFPTREAAVLAAAGIEREEAQ